PPLRIDPKRRVIAARTIARRQSYGFGRAEGLTSVIAVRQQDGVIRRRLFGATGEPRSKHTPLCGAF
ncbi:MAG: hypothetical protein ACK56I_10730, partial [bacterium]